MRKGGTTEADEAKGSAARAAKRLTRGAGMDWTVRVGAVEARIDADETGSDRAIAERTALVTGRIAVTTGFDDEEEVDAVPVD